MTVGFLSFAVCYKHGPLVDERSRSLLKWTLQLFSLFLIYSGVSVPQFAYTVILLIPLSRSLHYPMKAFSHMRWYVSGSAPPKISSSGFIVRGNFFGCFLFNLINNYISSGDFPLREGEGREHKHLI